MSNPILSLKKSKRPPLYLPEMPSHTPLPQSISAFNSHSTNQQGSLNKLVDLKENELNSSVSSLNSGYSKAPILSSRKSPINSIDNNFKILSSIKLPMPNEFITSSRVPFKSTIDENDLMDEVTTKMATNNMKRNLLLANNKSVINDKTPSDMELMQIMMSKIKQTEARCAIFEKESKEKEKKIQILQEKLDLYKKIQAPSKDETVKELERKNKMLQKQIVEMENFLADYGLYWVGEKNSTDSILDENGADADDDDNQTVCSSNDLDEKVNHLDSNYTQTNPTIEHRNRNQQFVCDFDLMIKNINELNSLTDYNEAKIVEFSNNGAKFETTKSIRLSLYANGIALYNGPFRPFSDLLTRKFCIDIMDGYFPSELQSKYPDGVPFELIDRRDIYFKDERNSVLNTKGYRLGNESESNDSHTEPPTTTTNKKNIETLLLEKPMTVEQFLNKLPGSVVKNGRVIQIRNDISSLINADMSNNNKNSNVIPQDQVIIVETPVLNEIREKYPQLENKEDLFKLINDDELNKKLTTLRVKSLLNNESAYLLKMNYTDTIRDLKEHIKSQRKSLQIVDAQDEFDLASVYPRKIFENLNLTLEESDLVPNSNIILIPRKTRKF